MAYPHWACPRFVPVSPHPGCIQVSEVTRGLLPNYTFEDRGGIEVKGKVDITLA